MYRKFSVGETSHRCGVAKITALKRMFRFHSFHAAAAPLSYALGTCMIHEIVAFLVSFCVEDISFFKKIFLLLFFTKNQREFFAKVRNGNEI